MPQHRVMTVVVVTAVTMIRERPDLEGNRAAAAHAAGTSRAVART